MAGVYIGGSKITTNSYLGAARANRIYLGATKVWQGWLAARTNVTANLTGTGTNWLDVSNVGAGDSQTVVSGTSTVVQGMKTNAQVTVQANVSGGSFPDSRVRILINGTVLSTSGSNGSSFTHTWTGNLNDGDLVRFQYYGEGQFFSRPTLQTSSYMTIG